MSDYGEKSRNSKRTKRAYNYLKEILRCIDEEDMEGALTLCDRLIQNGPEFYEGHHYKVMLLLKQGELKRAEQTLTKAQRLFPEAASFLVDRMILLEQMGEYQQAAALLEQGRDKLDGGLYPIKYEDIWSRTGAMEKAAEGREADQLCRICREIQEQSYLEALYGCRQLKQKGEQPVFREAAAYLERLCLQHIEDEDGK